MRTHLHQNIEFCEQWCARRTLHLMDFSEDLYNARNQLLPKTNDIDKTVWDK